MKKLIAALTFIVLAGLAAFGQGPSPKPKATPSKPVAAPFTRERFDPARDPKIDLANAVKTATATGKRIILDVGGEWCGWCVYMDKFFYLNPPLAKLRDDNFVWIKVNSSEQNENRVFLEPYPTPTGYPHLYVLDAGGKLLHSQDTSPLEDGNSYNLGKFTKFLKTWSPPKETRTK